MECKLGSTSFICGSELIGLRRWHRSRERERVLCEGMRGEDGGSGTGR